MSLLAIDVGNSRVKVGLFDSATATGLPAFHGGITLPIRDTDATTIGDWLEEQEATLSTALLGGVNPRVIAAIHETWPDDCGALTVLDRPSPRLLVNRTDSPERVGPDRLFDAVAANRLRPAGVSSIVIDSGTATTVDLIDARGTFRGGSIVPGFELVAAALHERTALLPKIDVVDLSPPPAPVGRNTADALRSGLYWSLVGGVKELVLRIAEAEPSAGPPLVLLTGGAAPLLAPHLPTAVVEPHLTLQGMILTATSTP